MTTFEQLEQQTVAGEQLNATSALGEWYESVRTTPIERLSVEDLAIAVRQNLFLREIVPLALKVLDHEPLAGSQYDGELLAAMNSVPTQFWMANSSAAESLKKILNCLVSPVDPDIAADMKALWLRLRP